MNRIFATLPYDESSLIWSPTGETIVALAVMAFLAIMAIIVFILVKKADPIKRPKGLLMLVEWAVEKIDVFVETNMGKGFENFGGLFLAIIPFVFISFIISITGLPSPMTNMAVPLTLALVTFTLIHLTSMKYTKWKYFKRFIDPIPVFLPINLISMWAPLLSMTLRMFGNAVVGMVIISVCNWALGAMSAALFSFIDSGVTYIFFAPFVTPVFHAYFDLFSGLIQTLVFCYLTALYVSQEKPMEEDFVEKTSLIKQGKEVK